MAEQFTDEEQKVLSRFFTNLDKPVFALRNLPEVVKGALFSRYSRSSKSLRRVLMDEFINAPETGFKEIVNFDTEKGGNELVAIKKAEEFYDRVLVGYGDDSVAELAGAHIAVENVSNIATKILQDGRIGLSPLEKSTRYVYFDQKINDHYLYYEEPVLMASEFANLYKKTMERLFDTYSKLIPEVSKQVMEKFPIKEGVSERAYRSTIRAKTCDILRGLLPAATLTNTGIFGNGRAFEYLLTKMYASPLTEVKVLAGSMNEELGKVIPSFVKRANDKYGQAQQEFFSETRKAVEEVTKETLAEGILEPASSVRLVDFEVNHVAEIKAVTAILYSASYLSMENIRNKALKMTADQRKKIIDEYCIRRKNRRHKPGRAFENIYYTFDILGNYGLFRDLHRHRILTQERQYLSTRHGFDTPKELVEFELDDEFEACMEAANTVYKEIAKTYPKEAQYLVPLAYKLRWYMTLNLREAYHFCELRAMVQGHIDYRKIAQEIYLEIKKVHPVLGEHMKFVDMSESELERLESEKKIDKKLEEISKKYGS
ncbi:FAD-dependent thymidylate synthase [Candidatus Micrarchaeota archaeon]|nr:FAD-dependent thymidylate synthase [Candidatus Micrarchaeota archaeon]